MTTNQGQGFQNILNTAQGFIGGNQQQQALLNDNQGLLNTAKGFLGGNQQQQGALNNNQGQGLLNTAQGFLGGNQQQGGLLGNNQQGGLSKINNTIDTAQAFSGHTGQGGTGIQGFVDKAQGLTGHQGPTGGIQGALNTVQGLHGMQQVMGSGQGTGGQGILNSVQGVLGGGNQQQQLGQQSNFHNINNTIDQVQGFMGHTGQGGTGFQATIDKAQGLVENVQGGQVTSVQGLKTIAQSFAHGQGSLNDTQPTGGVQGLVNTAQGVLGNRQGQGQNLNQNLNRGGGLNNMIDKAQGGMGHTGQGGTGLHGAIDKAQGFIGHNDQTGMN